MPLVAPDMLLNSIMGKVYNVLTNGDDTVPKSEDNFFSWATPGIPVQSDDFRFLKEGLTGVVRKPALADVLPTNPDGTPAPPTEISPALLEQLRAEDAAQLLKQAEDFARLVDFVPDLAATTNNQFASLSVMNNEGTLSERYEYILRMSQVMHNELPDETKAKIEKFRALLQTTTTKKNLIDDTDIEVTSPSALVQAYETGQKNYDAAALQYNSKRIDGLSASNQRAVHDWAINANIYRNSVNTAMSEWVNSGYKNDYEAIAAFIDQVMQRDMALLKQQYRQDLDKARLTSLVSGSDFYYSAAVPGGFMDGGGWTEFGFSSSDYNNSSNSNYSMSRSTTSGGGGFLGIFGGGGTHTEASGQQASHVSFDSEYFSMSFQIAQIPIVRPWFKTAYLNSKSWRMDQNNPEAKGQFASDGGTPAKGMLPAYPTSLILVRNLSLCFSKSDGFSDLQSSWESSENSGGGYFSFGPFFLGGSHGSSGASGQKSSQYHFDSATQTMRVDGTQIIGFKCHVLPKSPDPLSSITDWI